MAREKRYPPMGFPDRLNTAIHDKNYSRKYVAMRVGLERKSIYTYVWGDSMPDVLTLARLCKLLDVSADYLLFGEEAKQ